MALIALWFAATAWARPLMLPDEGRYAGVAWEMIRSGDWMTPTLDGLPFLHKPPLFYWITASAMSVVGVHEWTARVAPIIGASLGAFGLYRFTQRWCGQRTARFSLIALLLQPMFYLGAQFANLDMLVAGCITATILLGAHAALSLEAGLSHRRPLLVAYAMAAAGVLAKGLVGVAIPAMVLVCWLALRRRWQTLRAMLSPAGVGVFLGLGAPWFAIMQWRFPDFAHYFFVVQHFKRFAAAGFNNALPFWFFAAVLLAVNLPWLPWLYRLISVGYLAHPVRGAARLLMILWAVLVVLFFSIPQSKLIGYILPAVAPLAFMIGDGFAGLARPTRLDRVMWWAGGAVAMTVNIAAVVILTMQPLQSARELGLELRGRRTPADPVFMVSHYYYDLALYAGLEQPAGVVEDWSRPDIFTNDNWRRELAEAGRFSPAKASSVLTEPSRWPSALCGAPVKWIVGPSAAIIRYPFLTAAQAVFTFRGNTIWRIDPAPADVARVLDCPRMPNANSTDR